MQVVEKKVNLQPQGAGEVVVLCTEEELRDVIAYWSEALPVRTFVAGDGYEANRKLKTLNAGLLITDRILPPWPGLDTFRQLRGRAPNLHIAFVDDGTPENRVLARVTGATALLPRPLTRQAVVEALARAELVS
jgi:DNA-binding response OmpR family regulator